MSASEIRLPPGPRLPRVVQTAGFVFGGFRFLDAVRRRYGGAVYLRTLFDDGFVMVFDPALVKQLFQGSNGQLHAGEANALLGPVLGERSVLLLDEEDHLRHRRLMLPPFHGARMQGYAAAMIDAADRAIDAWPVGEAFPIIASMQALTLDVIIQAVFGFDPGAEADRLRRALRAMIEPVARPRGAVVLALLSAGRFTGNRASMTREFERRREEVDELLFGEIARRRADPGLESRQDVFSTLLLARDEAGEPLSDREVRDELVTLLVAGHETTATGLAWAFDLLLHHPLVLRRAQEGGVEYLDAVVKEALRIRPVIPGVGRVVRGEPFRLGEWVIPEGVEINPSIRVIHHSAAVYGDPRQFRPDRFLGPDAPDTYTWIPFGGGTRRCLGASFAQLEMRIVLERVLARAPALRAASAELDPVQFRGITLAPRDGVRVVLDSPPLAAPANAEPVAAAA